MEPYALEGGFMNTNDIILTIDAEISHISEITQADLFFSTCWMVNSQCHM